MKIVERPVWKWTLVERPPMSQRSHIAISGSTAIWPCSVACRAPSRTSGGSAPLSRSGSTYQSAWVTKCCSGSSRATMSNGSWSEIETRWKAITCSVTETSPKCSSTPEVVRCSRIRSM